MVLSKGWSSRLRLFSDLHLSCETALLQSSFQELNYVISKLCTILKAFKNIHKNLQIQMKLKCNYCLLLAIRI